MAVARCPHHSIIVISTDVSALRNKIFHDFKMTILRRESNSIIAISTDVSALGNKIFHNLKMTIS
jgi:hypothetical protein